MMGTVMDEKHTRFEPKSLADVSQAPGQTAVTPVKFTLHPPARKEDEGIIGAVYMPPNPRADWCFGTELKRWPTQAPRP